MALTLSSAREKGQAGYFRIGLVTLTIPPSDISTSKATGDEEIFPLRGKFALHRKSGHSRWDCTVHWRALWSPADTSQWEDVQTVLAMFKAAPFVEVENAHLRQILMVDPDSGTEEHARMAFALRQMKVDTVTDVPQALDVTLTMSWFNYLPYSDTFAYLGQDGQEVDAYQSDDFKRYIEAWKRENLDAAPNPFAARADLAEKYGYGDLAPWREQNAGTATFSWRTYIALPRTGSPTPGGPSWQGQGGGAGPAAPPSDQASPGAPGAPSAPIERPRGKGKKSPMKARTAPEPVKSIIVNTAKSLGVDCNLCLAVSQRESSYNPLAKNRKTVIKNGVAVTTGSSATGLFQLLDGTAKQWGVSNATDAQQNATGGIKYIKYLLHMFHNDTTMALTAFAAGEGTVKKLGVDGAWAKFTWIPGWLDDIGNIYAELSGQPAAQPQTAFADRSDLRPPAPSPEKTAVEQLKAGGVEEEVIAKVAPYLAGDWSLDHWTERMIFLYGGHELTVADEEHGDGPNLLGLYPVQISVVFVNNLPLLPLESHQYPVFQHIGPAGTMIVVGLLSRGELSGEDEPRHEGLAQLSGMCSSLESQYHRLKGEWRSVSSIHRMQAVVVENQVLNLLGIRGAMLRGFNTDTIADSPNLAQASLLLSQYENVFEELSPFQVKGSGAAYQSILDNLAKGGGIDKLVKDNPNSVYAPLKKYRDQRAAYDSGLLLRMLSDSSYACPPIAMGVSLDQTQLGVLKDIMEEDRPLSFWSSRETPLHTWKEIYPEIAARIESGEFSYADYYRLVQDPDLSQLPSLADIRTQINAAIVASGPVKSPIDRLYDQALDYLATKDLPTIRAVEELERDPAVKSRMQASLQPDGPGLAKENAAHGAYNDLGLKTINLGARDFNPAYYFFDYGKAHQARLESQAALAAGVAVEALNTFSRKAGSSHIPVSSSPAPGAKMDGSPNGQGLFEASSTVKAILAKTTLPYLSMTRAFPTYKLFLMEESNQVPLFYMFDNFYSYGSVLNIEITKSQDPTKDVAVITLTNFSNLFSHRLYDGTAAGRQEYALENTQEVPDNSNQDASQGGVAGKGRGAKNPLGVPETVEVDKDGTTRMRRIGLNLSTGFDNLTPSPLQYYPLQTGAKVQIRMGFSNNPDRLWPVFNGKVTQIEGSDVLQVVCQGFAIELTDPAPETLDHDGYLSFGTIANLWEGAGRVAADVLHPTRIWRDFTNSFGPGPAFGSFTVLGDSGITDTVIEKVLKTSRATHFGHWQIDPARNQSNYVKGFGWLELASAVASPFSSHISALLNSFRDRRGENIMINGYLDSDGSGKDDRLIRPWQFEQPLGIYPAQYFVPNDPAITPWRIINDIRRRYAEYILAVRPYGFPVAADATLVFAQPNDVYTAAPSIGDSLELEVINESDQDAFREWWGTPQLPGEGRRRFLDMANDPGGGSLSADVLTTLGLGITTTSVWQLSTDSIPDILAHQVDSGGAKTFKQVMDTYTSVAHKGQFVSKVITASSILAAATVVGAPAGVIAATAASNVGTKADRLLRQVQKLIQLFASYKQLRKHTAAGGRITDPVPGDRIQPVRRWHVINKDVIIHNGIRLNDQIYNATRINRDIQKANANILNCYTRILDCDRAIIEPEKNTRDFENPYHQSFLREELGKMYGGELVLTGMPEIEPYDVLILYDPASGTMGPVEVGAVVHSFNPESGYISIVTPRALVILNDFLSMGVIPALMSFVTSSLPGEVSGAAQDAAKDPKIAAAGAGGALAAYGLGRLAIAAAERAAASALGAVSVTLAVPPLAIAAGIAVVSVAVLLWMSDTSQRANPVFLAPLQRFGKPWVGGLQGWQISDLHTLYANKFHQFWDFEVSPTIEGFKILHDLSSQV